MPLPEALKLYLVVGEADCGTRPLEWLVEQAVRGGVTAVQLREKACGSAAIVEKAKNLRRLLDPLGIPLVINDDLEAAIASGAAGLHVGQEDRPVEEARTGLPDCCRLGLSITNSAEALAAEGSAADHLGIGPVCATASKADAAPALGLGGLRQVRALRPERPAVAIGGITLENAASVMAQGVQGLAVVSAIASAKGPLSATRTLRQIVEQALSERTRRA